MYNSWESVRRGFALRLGESACNKLRDTEALEDGCPSRGQNGALRVAHFTGLRHAGVLAGFLTLRSVTLRRCPLGWAPAGVS